MLALDFVEAVADGAEEIVVRVEDRAVELEGNHGLRFSDGVYLPGVIGVLQGLRGNIGGVFDDLERFTGRIEDRVVGRLDPDFRAVLADALVFAGLEFAGAEPGPEFGIFVAFPVGRFHEQAVMLALDLVEAVADGAEEVVVRVEDRAV